MERIPENNWDSLSVCVHMRAHKSKLAPHTLTQRHRQMCVRHWKMTGALLTPPLLISGRRKWKYRVITQFFISIIMKNYSLLKENLKIFSKGAEHFLFAFWQEAKFRTDCSTLMYPQGRCLPGPVSPRDFGSKNSTELTQRFWEEGLAYNQSKRKICICILALLICLI